MPDIEEVSSDRRAVTHIGLYGDLPVSVETEP